MTDGHVLAGLGIGLEDPCALVRRNAVMIAAHTGMGEPSRTGNMDLALVVAWLAQDMGYQIRQGFLEVVRVTLHRLGVGRCLDDDGLVAGRRSKTR